MGGKEKEGRVGGRRKGKGGEGKGERMWRGPESGLPRGPCWLSAGLNTEAARQFLADLVRTISHHSADEHIINVSQFCFFVLIRFFLHDSFLN